MTQNIWKYLIACCVILLSVSSTQQLYASHAMGADITYTCLGGNTYEITLTFYRDCDGITAPTNPSITIESASCGPSTTLTLTQQGPGVEVSPLCPAQLPNSTCNGGSLQGVEQYFYTGTYTLPLNCTDWTFSYSVCCRNAAITNSLNPNTNNIYVEAKLNSVIAPCNNSPTFTTPPVPYVCAGQPFNYNHGAFDSDGDSLIYKLNPPLDDPATPVPYIAPFNPGYPISTTPANNFMFDASNGQMTFTPANPQIGIVAVVVQEYRNGMLIGSTIRDMQVVVISCSNQVPAVTPVDTTTITGGTFDGSTFTVCAGNSLFFEFGANDPDPADILTVTSNIGTNIPGASINTVGTNPVLIQFNWATTVNDGGNYNFTVTVSDNACPIAGNQIIGFDILVPSVEISAPDTTICGDTTTIIQLNATPIGGTGLGSYNWAPTTGLSNPNIANPIATVTGPIQYVVTYDDGVCLVTDTVNIVFAGILDATPEIANLCPGESAQLNADFSFTESPTPPGCGLNASGCNGPGQQYTVGTDATATGPLSTSNEAGSPFLGYYHDGRVQYLFRASELTALGMTSGLITDVSFDVSSVFSTQPYNNFTIKLACTQDTTFNTLSFDSTGVVVYTGAVTPVLGINNFTFQNQYEWDGLSNLIVEVCFDNAGYTNYDHVFYSQTSFNSVLYSRIDNGTGCTLAATLFSDRRANMVFGSCPAVPIFQNVTYSWSPTTGLNNPNIPNPIATPPGPITYVVTATTDECTFKDTVYVNLNTLNLNLSGTSGCGSSQGSITVNILNGTGPFTFNWDNGLPPIQNHPSVPLGTYNVTVTDANGCTNTATITLSNSLNLTISVDSTMNINCNGGSNGSISTTATSGTPPYIYTWNSGQTTDDITGLMAGIYTLTVTDAAGCLETLSANVTEPNPIVIQTTTTDPTCNTSNGSITATATGGTPAYQYGLDGGALGTQNTWNNLPAGTYAIIVVDSLGCSDTTSAILNPGITPIIDSVQTVTPTCAGNDGEFTIFASGGTPPYQYTIGGGLQPSNVFTGLGSGNYIAVVVDALGCSDSTIVILNNPIAVAIDSISVTPTSCGSANGEIVVYANNGTPAYQYSIDGGGTYQGSNVFTGLGSGPYTIAVLDANGCTDTQTINIAPSTQLNIVNVIGVDGTCGQNNGTIEIILSGGVLNYMYSIDGGVTFQTSNIFMNLPPGTYPIVVEDAVGCSDNLMFTIISSSAPIIDSVVDTDPSTCGSMDGSIVIFATQGTPPIQYSIDNGTTYQTSNSFPNLGAGTYDVIVSDSSGCADTTVVILQDPNAPVIDSISTVQPNCGQSDGSISIFLSGGNPNYEYSIDGGTTWQGANTFTNLPAGTYLITVQDFLGCQNSQQIILLASSLVNIASVTGTNATCGLNNGSIDIVVSGGTPPFSYTIDGGTTTQTSPNFPNLPPGTYTVGVTDAAGCTATQQYVVGNDGNVQIDNIVETNPSSCNTVDGSLNITASGGQAPYQFSIDNGTTFQGSGVFTNLADGTYNVVVVDDNGCTQTATAILVEPNAPAIDTVLVTDPTCGQSNGSIEIIVSGGSPSFEYSIDGGTTFQGGNTFINLPAGFYYIVVEDVVGCQVIDSVAISNPGAPQLNLSSTDPICGNVDGTITINVNGGTPPFQYSIDGGATVSTNNTYTNLPGGVYNIVVTDAAGCQALNQLVLVDNGIVNISNAATTPPLCGASNGSITVLTNGGTAPYEYSIDGGVTWQTSNIFNGLAGGSYTITVRDSNNCQDTETVVIADDGSPTISVNTVDASCDNFDGQIEIIVTGGTGPYQYSIDNGGTYSGSNVFTGLGDGTYEIVLVDFNGCQVMDTVALSNSSATQVQITPSGPTDICFGDDLTLDAGSGYSTYVWSTGNNNQTITATTTAFYGVTVVDPNGCESFDEIEVTVAPQIDLEVIELDTIELGDSVMVSVQFPNPNYTYNWTGSDGSTYTGPSFLYPANDEGLIMFTVTASENGCSATAATDVFVFDSSNWDMPNAFSPNGDGLNDSFGPALSGTLRLVNLQIFNRWGEKVHDGPTEWDGTHNDKEQDQEVFIYRVTLESASGKQYTKTGDFLLMK